MRGTSAPWAAAPWGRLVKIHRGPSDSPRCRPRTCFASVRVRCGSRVPGESFTSRTSTCGALSSPVARVVPALKSGNPKSLGAARASKAERRAGLTRLVGSSSRRRGGSVLHSGVLGRLVKIPSQTGPRWRPRKTHSALQRRLGLRRALSKHTTTSAAIQRGPSQASTVALPRRLSDSGTYVVTAGSAHALRSTLDTGSPVFRAGSTTATGEERAPHVEVRLVKDSPGTRLPQRTRTPAKQIRGRQRGLSEGPR